MNNLNFTISGKESSRKAVHGNCMTISVKEFITPELAEKTAKALWNKPEWADAIISFNYENKINTDCFKVLGALIGLDRGCDRQAVLHTKCRKCRFVVLRRFIRYTAVQRQTYIKKIT